jgi:hypothetical protein
VSVAVADEASAFGRLKNGGFENPEFFIRLAQGKHRLGMNTVAVAPLSQAQQIPV